MTWKNKSNSPAEWIKTLEEMVGDTVVWYRNRGHPRSIAIGQTALALGISPRKTRSIFDREPVGLTREEFERTFEAYLNHLDVRAQDHLFRISALKAKRKQMELLFE